MSQEPEKLELDNSDDNSFGNEYLTFRLGQEDYGIDILRVKEIRGYESVTRIPNQPDYVKGVLNLRGLIVPIFDLRERLAMDARAYDKETVVIVIATRDAVGERSLGLIVDEVSDVLNTEMTNVKNSPDFGDRMNTDYISGLASAEGRMVMLLDVDRLQAPRGADAQVENDID